MLNAILWFICMVLSICCSVMHIKANRKKLGITYIIIATMDAALVVLYVMKHFGIGGIC